MNPETVIYPGLISLEVSEADVLSRAADEQASRVRPSDAAVAADRVRPEVHCTVFSLLTACIGEEKTFLSICTPPSGVLTCPTVRLDFSGALKFSPDVLPRASKDSATVQCVQTVSSDCLPSDLVLVLGTTLTVDVSRV